MTGLQGLQIGREDHPGGTTLKLHGVFDGGTALELRRYIEALESQSISLDFSGVRTYVDLAVAILTGGFRDREVELCGLPRHQERMFRYFGVLTRAHEHSAAAEELLAG